jgi:inhibitor of KinA sporulation pathway (predicted exonuclease)
VATGYNLCMAKLLDQVLVIDIESTCWQGPAPQGMVSEIIEVGLCLVDLRTLERSGKRCLLIRPTRSQIGPFCTQLTTLTIDQFGGAGTLADVVSILKREYRTLDRLWASWGDYDRRQFERNCKEFTVPYPFGASHLNIKTLFAIGFGDPKEIGIDEACDRLKIPMEGTHHRGVDDAWNIAGIFCKLLQRMREQTAV